MIRKEAEAEVIKEGLLKKGDYMDIRQYFYFKIFSYSFTYTKQTKLYYLPYTFKNSLK